VKTAIGRTRPHCTCAEVRNYDYAAAAEKLGCKKRFLQDRISRLPHQRLGESVVFCDCELRIIQQMFTVIPDEIWQGLLNQDAQPAETPQAPALSLHNIRPAGARRPRAAAVT
jgi:hypothetical protein